MSKEAKRGGARKGAGRKKAPLAPALESAKLDGRNAADRAVAGRVLQKENSEQLWRSLITIEKKRLGIGDDGKLVPPDKGKIDAGEYQGNYSVIPLKQILEYLENRHFGRPHESSTVNHVHDKPIDLNVNVSMAELVREVRERKAQYERGRHK